MRHLLRAGGRIIFALPFSRDVSYLAARLDSGGRGCRRPDLVRRRRARAGLPLKKPRVCCMARLEAPAVHIPMKLRSLTGIVCAAVLAAPLMGSDPAKDVAAALMRLQDERSYAWESSYRMDADQFSKSTEPGRRGVLEKGATQDVAPIPTVRGHAMSTGDTVVRVEYRDGLNLVALIRKDGAAMVLTPFGWMSDQEITDAIAALKELAVNNERLRILTAAVNASKARRPPERLTTLFNSAVSFRVVDDEIIADLPPSVTTRRQRAVDSSVGQITVILQDGRIRQVVVRHDTTLKARAPAPGTTVPVQVLQEQLTTFNYAPRPIAEIPAEVRRRFHALRAPSG